MSTFTLHEAADFFEQWREFSEAALARLAPKCPPTPGHKTRPWDHPEGPVGLLVHYTGGPDGIASLRWSNENGANKGSSWHCTVLDSRLVNLDELLEDYPMVEALLPVTALLHADVNKGTWHGNWANSRCFGLENRNLGALSQAATDGDGDPMYARVSPGRVTFPKSQKRVVEIRGQHWESFTKEQLVANINIGKMLLAWRGEHFNRSWVLPHSMVWASKRDVGSAYPMYWVRDAIFSDEPVEEMEWLQKGYSASLVDGFIDIDDAVVIDESPRDSGEARDPYVPMMPFDFDKIHGSTWRDFIPSIRENLEVLGAWAPPREGAEAHTVDLELQTAVSILQRSSHAPGGPNLKVDGVPGPATRDFIDKRLRTFGHDV